MDSVKNFTENEQQLEMITDDILNSKREKGEQKIEKSTPPKQACDGYIFNESSQPPTTQPPTWQPTWIHSNDQFLMSLKSLKGLKCCQAQPQKVEFDLILTFTGPILP